MILSSSSLSSLFFTFLIASFFEGNTCLYPSDSETRQTKFLDGIWDFALSPIDDQDKGFTDSWFTKPLRQVVGHKDLYRMPVPSSFNDITTEKRVRDYVGWVWYQTSFFIPQEWLNNQKTVHLRFDSVHYSCRVYLNDELITSHTGGHLPFTVDITGNLKNSALNRLTIAVNNTLSVTTSPQGKVDEATGRLKPDFDFFNYAGIHRSVRLYAVPSIHITDVTVVTSTIEESGSARLRFSFVYDERKEQFQQNNLSSKDVVSCSLEVIDAEQQEVARINACSGSLLIDNPHLWWPVGMAEKPGYQYTGRFVLSNGSEVVDVYYQKFGLRTIQVAEKFLLINGKNIYIRGFGRHEDSSIRGRGLDIPLIVKDNYLMHWIGANSFRTSHYPYSEELMSLADEEGFMVIDECPAVGLHDFNDDLYDQHAASIKELIQRDKNRPSVIAWSVANEPKSQDKRADNYFKRIVSLAKSLDNSRPITAATHSDVEKDLVTQHLDFLMINLYYGWYSNPGSTEVIKKKIIHDVTKWVNKHQKPVMMSEYGADTIAGIHSLPSFVFSEDYQAELVVQHFIAFDELRSKGLLFGEMIWNFADFMTDQTINRVFGNKKGIFTRDRQPKLSARLLRCRYHQLGNLTVSEDDFMLCPANTRS